MLDVERRLHLHRAVGLAVPTYIRDVMSVAALPMSICVPTYPIGVTRFGQSGSPDDLYREYEIDSDSIMAASVAALGI